MGGVRAEDIRRSVTVVNAGPPAGSHRPAVGAMGAGGTIAQPELLVLELLLRLQ